MFNYETFIVEETSSVDIAQVSSNGKMKRKRSNSYPCKDNQNSEECKEKCLNNNEKDCDKKCVFC